MERRKPGQVRNAIVTYLRRKKEAEIDDIHRAVEGELGGKVARSSVRSYLNLNVPETFQRTGRGKYRLV
jgi:hypothetical protein